MGEDDTGPGGQGSADIIEQGGRPLPPPGWLASRGWLASPGWRLSRGAAILGAAGLLAGLAAGYAAGVHRAGGSGRRAQRPAASAAPVLPAGAGGTLAQSGAGCSAQAGRQLQLGEQVTNQSGADVTLRAVRAVLPAGGLRVVSQQWQPCGVLPLGQEQPGTRLAPGASMWFTVTFQVLRGCPAPLPVQFTVDYDWQGHSAAASLPGFPDLGDVPYAGCPGS
jgi:hypothetical protein